jgi:homospermidine synthase
MNKNENTNASTNAKTNVTNNGRSNSLNFSVDIGSKKIFQVGCGGVGSSMPSLYTRHLKFAPGNVIICDKNKSRVDALVKQFPTIKFLNMEITKKNYKDIVNKYLTAGDVFVDLAWYISTPDLLQICHEKGIHFTNTAVEQWYDDDDCNLETAECETLYRHQHAIRKMGVDWGNKGPTAVIGHGANPGWVSHAMKIGMQDWVTYLLKKNSRDSDLQKAAGYLKQGEYNKAAQKLRIQVIHISERDTQITREPKKVGDFLCTWSPTGLVEEGALPAELGWGTHENMTQYVKKFSKGPGNEVFFPNSMAMNTTVKSYVPGSEVLGMVIPHEEANSISYFLTVKKGGRAVYRPTVHYAYMLPDVAIASLIEYQANGCPEVLKIERVIKDDIISGNDTLGVFFMSPKYGKFWTGSDLSIEQSRKLIPHQNATVVQVSPAVLAGIITMLTKPNLGPVFPEDMNSTEVMRFIKPYLGNWISKPITWEPSLRGVPEKYHKTKDLLFQKFLVSPPPTN